MTENNTDEPDDDGEAEEAPEKDRQFVIALARGLDILRCFTPESPALANQSIAERTGLPKPTVSRLTHTLCELEYLSFSQRSGAYHLGPGVLALGYATIASLEMREHLRPYMETLADMANVTVALGARDRLDVIYLDVCRGRQTVTLSRNVGSRLPIAKTAIGRAILAALPEIEQRFLIEALQKDDPENAADLERTIRTARDEIDRQGFCTSLGDGQPDVNAVAAPIRSLDGEQVYGLNVSGPAFMVPRDLLLQELGPRLARVARHLGGPDMKHRENWGI